LNTDERRDWQTGHAEGVRLRERCLPTFVAVRHLVADLDARADPLLTIGDATAQELRAELDRRAIPDGCGQTLLVARSTALYLRHVLRELERSQAAS